MCEKYTARFEFPLIGTINKQPQNNFILFLLLTTQVPMIYEFGIMLQLSRLTVIYYFMEQFASYLLT